MRATAVNRADTLAAPGLLPATAGRLRRARARVLGCRQRGRQRRRRLAVGDEVVRAARVAAGTPRRCSSRPGQLMPVPDGIDLVTAGALPEVACTVWSNRVHGRRPAARRDAARARWRRRDRHLRHPARERLGRPRAHHGGLAGEARRVPLARRRRRDRLPRAGLRRRRPRARPTVGVDVILDVMGASYLQRNVDALAVEGRLVVHRHAGRHEGRARPGRADAQAGRRGRLRRCAPGRSAEKAAICAAVVEHVWPLVADGSVKSLVHAHVAPRGGGRGAPDHGGRRARRQDRAHRLTWSETRLVWWGA